MRISLLDTYYPRFLSTQYALFPGLAHESYSGQLKHLIGQVFGTSDFYSHHLQAMGHDTQDLIVNCIPLQKAWAHENDFRINPMMLKFPQRLLRVPLLGLFFSALSSLVETAVEQIKASRPDVLYCQDLWFLPPNKLKEVRKYTKLIVGQIASPLPSNSYLKGYDLILTSFPHFVSRLRAIGVASEYFRIGFDERVIELLGNVDQDIDASFVGGISRHHDNSLPMLEYLANTTSIQFFGYGADRLSPNSPIVSKHYGEVWGLNMYRALARSRITLNRHINVAENNANNMRLFEATGVGTMLITDHKDNIGELFEVGKEIVTYSKPEEAAELIRYYTKHTEKANAIALAGQQRTLQEHTYKNRMKELESILHKYL